MPDRKGPKQVEAASRSRPKSEPRRVADERVTEAGSIDAGVKSPVTETGLPVEEQIRKEWDPKKQGGLPTSLARGITASGRR